jgi:hypothetical protein
MKARTRKKAASAQPKEKTLTKGLRGKTIPAKGPARSAKRRSSSATKGVTLPAVPRFISRRYLSPLGKGEISSRRITAAIKAVKKANALYDLEI